jgi:hypothetical protein
MSMRPDPVGERSLFRPKCKSQIIFGPPSSPLCSRGAARASGRALASGLVGKKKEKSIGPNRPARTPWPSMTGRFLPMIVGLAVVQSALAPLTDAELRAYATPARHPQPMWVRDAGVCASEAHARAPACKVRTLLEGAARLHQDGDLEASVDMLKKVLKEDGHLEHIHMHGKNHAHIEAYASLAKALDDQGKFSLADRARTKARKAAHELAKHAPF